MLLTLCYIYFWDCLLITNIESIEKEKQEAIPVEQEIDQIEEPSLIIEVSFSYLVYLDLVVGVLEL